MEAAPQAGQHLNLSFPQIYCRNQIMSARASLRSVGYPASIYSSVQVARNEQVCPLLNYVGAYILNT